MRRSNEVADAAGRGALLPLPTLRGLKGSSPCLHVPTTPHPRGFRSPRNPRAWVQESPEPTQAWVQESPEPTHAWVQ